MLAILLPILLTAFPAGAQTARWHVEVVTNPLNGVPVPEARIRTRDGYRFHIRKRDDNALWAEFTLPRNAGSHISGKRLPVYRIDDREPVDLESLKELETGFRPTLYEIDGKSIHFIIWGAVRQGTVPPPLRDFMLGDTLHIRYRTGTGNMEEAEIPLRQANETLARILDLAPLNRSPAIAEKRHSETFGTLARQYLDFCSELRFVGSDADFGRCRDRFVTCSEAPGQSEAGFRKCLGRP